MKNSEDTKKFTIFLYRIITKSFISRLFGYISLVPLPKSAMSAFIRWYSKKYNVRDEYIIPENGFRNINEFFTRRHSDGVRAIDRSRHSVVSAVDARLDQFGHIDKSSIIQAKGIAYKVEDLIPSREAEKYTNGSFFTLYLSPGDYHRIHSPVSGMIAGFYNIPGKLFTVQGFMVRGLKGLFAINERIITYITTDDGPVAVAKIGAMNVGKISLSYDDARSNRAIRSRREHLYANDKQIPIDKGDELGVFNLGSTVIILTGKRLSFNDLSIGQSVTVGEKIGGFLQGKGKNT